MTFTCFYAVKNQNLMKDGDKHFELKLVGPVAFFAIIFESTPKSLKNLPENSRWLDEF